MPDRVPNVYLMHNYINVLETAHAEENGNGEVWRTFQENIGLEWVCFTSSRGCVQVLGLISSEFKRINQLPCPLKSSENHVFFYVFRINKLNNSLKFP